MTSVISNPEPAGVEPLFPPVDETVVGWPGDALPVERKTGRRRWLWVTVSVALVLAVSGAGAATWILLHRPADFHAYDAAVQSTSSIALNVQASTDNLMSVSDLDAFGRMLTIRDGDLSAIAVQAQSLRNARQRELLLAAVSAERAYLAELERLVSLPSKTETAGQLQDVGRLGHSVDLALAAAISLHRSATPLVTVSSDASALTRLVNARHTAYLRANRARLRELAAVRSFTAVADGLIDRYSASRTDLSNWIDGVNTYGATFDEAYRELSQQSEVRTQLRGELAALEAPDALAADQQRLLAVIDRAISAMNGAVQGITQYQTSYYDGPYSSYDQTPGWQQFESESAAITQQYSEALAKYQADKTTLLARLSGSSSG